VRIAKNTVCTVSNTSLICGRLHASLDHDGAPMPRLVREDVKDALHSKSVSHAQS
jgi:hypothetical protein